MGPGFHHYYDGPGAGWVWGLLMLLFWAAFIGLIVWAVLRLTRQDGPLGPRPQRTQMPQHGTAREILDRRYAAGEIDAAAYEEMRARIEGPPGRADGPPET